MCGRYVIYDKLTSGNVQLLGHDIAANFNIAPSTFNPIIRLDDTHRPELIMARWGILPAFAKDTKITPFFNARADNLVGNKVFWSSKDRHCLVPMAGFYEWSEIDKQPYYIYPDNDELMYVAGLWRRFETAHECIDSYCIITTTAHPTIRDIHHRSPVILADKKSRRKWLSTSYNDGKALLHEYTGRLCKHPVSTRVNTSRASGKTLIQATN